MNKEITEKQRLNNEKRLANLRPFRKGASGNPAGRPKRENCLTSMMKSELEKEVNVKNPDGTFNIKTWAQLLAEALPEQALKSLKKGDIKPFALLIERVDGKVSQPITGEIKLSQKPIAQWSDEELDKGIRDIIEALQRGVPPSALVISTIQPELK